MKNIHFVGVGGIGMSGLAAAACDLGFAVSGSDRGADRPENRAIFSALKKQGISVFPQDGSRFDTDPLPDMVICSTAIEDDNPDLIRAGDIPRMHRSEFLRLLMDEFGRISVAVTGSCGKSTVCSYLTEALVNIGEDPIMLGGALAKAFKNERFAGNYRPGKGKYLVFEADESDKSLLNYGADYAVILNIGTDHYDKCELARVFSEFLKQVRRGAVMTSEVYEMLKDSLPENLPIAVADPDGSGVNALKDYRIVRERMNGMAQKDNSLEILGIRPVSGRVERTAAVAEFSDGSVLELPGMGRHMAINALCIKTLLEMFGFEPENILSALECFSGVWRRDDFAGFSAGGAMIYDDYAHNPEKILSCLSGMRERVSGNIYAVFQPHGYKPFGFMKDQLFAYMEDFLSPDDRFILLEPFYAGGSSSFKPGGAEVAAEYKAGSRKGQCYEFFPDKDELRLYLQKTAATDDLIVVMGARDNSLSDFAASIAEK